MRGEETADDADEWMLPPPADSWKFDPGVPTFTTWRGVRGGEVAKEPRPLSEIVQIVSNLEIFDFIFI